MYKRQVRGNALICPKIGGGREIIALCLVDKGVYIIRRIFQPELRPETRIVCGSFCNGVRVVVGDKRLDRVGNGGAVIAVSYTHLDVYKRQEKRRAKFAEKYHIPAERCYVGWKEILEEPKFADAAFVCTMDAMHTEPAVKAMRLGYDVLLEKPMSNTPEDCLAIEAAVRETGRALTVCHVLRYTSF